MSEEKNKKKKKEKRNKQNINGIEYAVINCKVKPYLDKNGNRKDYKKFYGKTKKECREKRDKFNADQGIAARNMFFGELVDDFIINNFLLTLSIRNEPSSVISMRITTTSNRIKSQRS